MLFALGLSASSILFVLLAAFATAVVHGATGMAGGVLLSAILSHFVGVKQAIALMTCALLFSHSSRVYFNRQSIDWSSVRIVMLFSAPTIFLGATIFTYLSASTVAITMASVLILSFPIKAWAARRAMHTTTPILAAASVGWGMLAGNVIGPGFVLAPFLLGTGMARHAFVASLAVIVLAMNAIKLTVFGSTQLFTSPMLLLGVAIGLATIPGNWLGRQLLNTMDDRSHRRIVDLMTVLVIINFIYLALNLS